MRKDSFVKYFVSPELMHVKLFMKRISLENVCKNSHTQAIFRSDVLDWERTSMKQYKFITIKGDYLTGAVFIEHRELIQEYTKKGYRYVGFVPVEITDLGKLKKIDLTFKTEE